MIKNKLALISSFVILAFCMYLFFPFPNNEMLEASITFMSFPIRNQDGYVLLGIIGSILFIIAMILLVIGLKKYQFQTVFIVLIAYTLLPVLLIMLYQETVANGIHAISYDGNGHCNFEYVSEDLLIGECNFELHNHSNEAVTFEIIFLDSFFDEDGIRMQSLMNLTGPHRFKIEANQKKAFHLNELLDLSDVPNHINGGTSSNIHFKFIDGETSRTL